jgi:hypothetical protein
MVPLAELASALDQVIARRHRPRLALSRLATGKLVTPELGQISRGNGAA